MHAPPLLPEYCSPVHPFLVKVSVFFGTCIPTPLSFFSSTLGLLSITAWLFSQLPQLIKNHKNRSVEGLSMLFLLNWLLGDVCNFLGAIMLNQMFFQKAVAAYYVAVDCVLMGQYFWYGIFGMGKQALPQVLVVSDTAGQAGGQGGPLVIHGLSMSPSESASSSVTGSYTSSDLLDVKKEKKAYSNGSSLGMGRTAQTMFTFATLVALASGLPEGISPFAMIDATTSSQPALVNGASRSEEKLNVDSVGLLIAWVSTSLYCTSRLPQLYKNYTRRSTAGLSIILFVAAFFGNLFYSISLLTNPLAWDDYEPYGGGGLAGAEGSKRAKWWANSLPFFIGASGVLCQDAAIYMQYLWWGDEKQLFEDDILASEPVNKKDSRNVFGFLCWNRVKGKGNAEEGEGLLHGYTIDQSYGTVAPNEC